MTEAFFVDEPAWVTSVLNAAHVALETEAPGHNPSDERQAALMLLDGPLHLVNANRYRSVRDFLVKRLTQTIEEIEASVITSGLQIWKLYNHGFVIRSPHITIGMDIVRGWRFFDELDIYYGLSDDWVERLVKQLDILTISHNHGDHQDKLVRDLAFANHIPVVVEASIFPEISAHTFLHRPQRRSHPPFPSSLRVKAKNGQQVDMLVYPGHQGASIPNNNYLVRTPDGYTIMHTGDQSGDEDWAWIDTLGQHQQVHILLVNCWSTDMPRLVAGIRPEWVIFGHEVEMAHTPDHRESFWRSFQIFRDLPQPRDIIMCWGEGFKPPFLSQSTE